MTTLNASDAIQIVKDAIAVNDEEFIDLIPTTFNINNLSLDDSYLLLNTFLEVATENNQLSAFNKLLSLWDIKYDNFSPPIQLSIFQSNIITDDVLKYFISNNPTWAFSEMINILIGYDQGSETYVALDRIFNLYDPINTYSNVDEILKLLYDKATAKDNKVVADYIWTFRKQTAPYAEKPKWIADYRNTLNIGIKKVNIIAEEKQNKVSEPSEEKNINSCNLAESVEDRHETKCNISLENTILTTENKTNTNPLPFADENYPVTQPDIETILKTNTLQELPEFLNLQAQKLGLASETVTIDFKTALQKLLNREDLTGLTLNDLPSEIKISFIDMAIAGYRSALQSDTKLFRWYGPAHPLVFYDLARPDIKSPMCALYGGCRMFTCLHGSLTDEYGEEVTVNPAKYDWFTGVCDQCGVRIKHKHYAVRLPDVAGGWSGTFHNFDCVRQWISNYADDDESEPLEFRLNLVDIFEKEILTYGIQDRVYKPKVTSEEIEEDQYSADEFQLYTGLPITEQSFIREGSFDP